MIISRLGKYGKSDIIIVIELVNNVDGGFEVRWRLGPDDRLVSEVVSFNTPSRSFQGDGMSDI